MLVWHLAGNQQPPKQTNKGLPPKQTKDSPPLFSSSGLKWQTKKDGRSACKNKKHTERPASLPNQLGIPTHVHKTEETEINVTEHLNSSFQHTHVCNCIIYKVTVQYLQKNITKGYNQFTVVITAACKSHMA